MIKILFFLLLFSISSAIAEPNDDSNSEVSTPKINKEQAETANQTPPTSISVNTPDSFDPTETLSQDIPTAFPVDI
jgi:hypothetical protein